MSDELRLILSGICIGLFVLARVGLSIIQKKHALDPEFQAKKRRREEEAREKIRRENEAMKNAELLNARFDEYDYSDDYTDEYDDAYQVNNETQE